MTDLTYIIDCGQQNPFWRGRKIRRPADDADQIDIELIDAENNLVLTVRATKQVFNVDVIGYRGLANGRNFGFFFDSSRTRMVGIVTASSPRALQGVYGAHRLR
ncbi:MAG: hypothetical protein AAGD38_20830 [Acidobacteriota bacterium]